MFTAGADGIGLGSITHLNGSLVTAANPAQIGESVVLYASGLGAVTPAIADGSAGPTGPLSYTASPIGVTIGGAPVTNIEFAGLAPYFFGLYQINFAIPTGVPPGEWYCDLSTNSSYFAQATIAIAGSSSTLSNAAQPAIRKPRQFPARRSRSGVTAANVPPLR